MSRLAFTTCLAIAGGLACASSFPGPQGHNLRAYVVFGALREGRALVGSVFARPGEERILKIADCVFNDLVVLSSTDFVPVARGSERWKLMGQNLLLLKSIANPLIRSAPQEKGIDCIPLSRYLADQRLYKAIDDSRPLDGVNRTGGPIEHVIDHGSTIDGFTCQTYMDILPLGSNEVYLVTLHNHRYDIINERGPTGGPAVPLCLKTRPQDEHWQMLCWTYSGQLNPVSDSWSWTEYSFVGSLDVGFREPFRAFAKGDHWLFVTDSGKLYVANRPGGKRSIRIDTAWDNDKWPIRAIISDVDRNKTFLFVRKSENWNVTYRYFELDSQPEPRAVDLESVKDIKVEGDLGLILRLARAIGYEAK